MDDKDVGIARQSGFTLAEAMVALVVLAVMTGIGVKTAKSQIEQAKLESTIAEARKIANVAESVRITAVGTSIDAVTGIYSHTYQTLPAESSVGALQAMASGNVKLPSVSPFGTAYRVEVTDELARVTVRVPFQASPQGVGAVPVGPETDLVVYPRIKTGYTPLTNPAKAAKIIWYLEDPR